MEVRNTLWIALTALADQTFSLGASVEALGEIYAFVTIKLKAFPSKLPEHEHQKEALRLLKCITHSLEKSRCKDLTILRVDLSKKRAIYHTLLSFVQYLATDSEPNHRFMKVFHQKLPSVLTFLYGIFRNGATVCLSIHFMIYSERKSQFGSRDERKIPGQLSQTFASCAGVFVTAS